MECRSSHKDFANLAQLALAEPEAPSDERLDAIAALLEVETFSERSWHSRERSELIARVRRTVELDLPTT